jgi:two-component system, OmpR family, alkaline phosphatase synthesis response regulator PhoP
MTASPEETRPVDVLIAEDDPLVRQTVRRLLEAAGYHCAEAGDGREAVELALHSPPRCAILDLVMPGMDGLTAASQLRADPRTRGMHIHCLTGVPDPSSRALAEEAGFDSYQTKPFVPSQLLGVIRGEAREAETVVERTGLSLDQARDLMDDWENAGYRDLEADYKEGAGFTVRGVRPAS